MSRYSTAENFQKKEGSQKEGPRVSSLTLPLLGGEEPLANRAQEITIRALQRAAESGDGQFDELLREYIVKTSQRRQPINYENIASLIETSRENGTPRSGAAAPRAFDAGVVYDLISTAARDGDIDRRDFAITAYVLLSRSNDVIDFDYIREKIVNTPRAPRRNNRE